MSEPNLLLALLPTFLRSLAAISKDPALGYRGSAITSALTFGATAIERGAEARASLQEITDYLASLAKGEEPSKQVWYDLKARNDAAEMLFNPPPPEESPGGEPVLDQLSSDEAAQLEALLARSGKKLQE